MILKPNNHWMSVYFNDKIYDVDTIFYGSKSMVLKDAKGNILPVTFDEIDKISVNII